VRHKYYLNAFLTTLVISSVAFISCASNTDGEEGVDSTPVVSVSVTESTSPSSIGSTVPMSEPSTVTSTTVLGASNDQSLADDDSESPVTSVQQYDNSGPTVTTMPAVTSTQAPRTTPQLETYEPDGQQDLFVSLEPNA
jgi:hypothetical protein